MLKQFLIMLVLTIAGVFFIKELGVVLHGAEHLQALLATYIAKSLPFSQYKVFISQTVTLILLPIIIALIPAFFFWLFAKKDLPRLMLIFWLFWLISIIVFACSH